MRLNGLLYNRIGGSPLNSIYIFEQLCGVRPYAKQEVEDIRKKLPPQTPAVQERFSQMVFFLKKRGELLQQNPSRGESRWRG